MKRKPTGPALLVGEGERRDCGRYEACLDAFAKRYLGKRRDADGHCPPECRWWCAVSDDVRRESAGRSNGWQGWEEA